MGFPSFWKVRLSALVNKFFASSKQCCMISEKTSKHFRRIALLNQFHKINKLKMLTSVVFTCTDHFQKGALKHPWLMLPGRTAVTEGVFVVCSWNSSWKTAR